MNTTEGNKLIAEFMGAVFDGRKYMTFLDGNKRIHAEGYDSQLKYHTSWDWLHGAWEKFRGLNLSEVDEGFNDTYSRHLQAVGTAIVHYKVEIAFERLARAITWYTSLHP